MVHSSCSDWSATIEFTDAVNGSTYVYRELYSQTLNKVRLILPCLSSRARVPCADSETVPIFRSSVLSVLIYSPPTDAWSAIAAQEQVSQVPVVASRRRDTDSIWRERGLGLLGGFEFHRLADSK